jgi:hypothetical protein
MADEDSLVRANRKQKFLPLSAFLHLDEPILELSGLLLAAGPLRPLEFAEAAIHSRAPRVEVVMRLDARAFGIAAGIVAAALFTVCALAVAAAPEPTTALASYLVHLDLSEMSRTLTFGSFIGGLIIWTLGTAVSFGCAAAIYNRLVARAPTAEVVAPARPATLRA